MNESALFWLGLTLLCIAAEAFYASVEMAIVSFNPIRLQYYIAKGQPRVLSITWLLEHPTRLFSTTLFSVNAAMQIGSECSRRFYMASNLSADWAPLTQVFLVLLVAELAPIFAARRYPEQIAMAGSGILYYSARCMTPLIWVISYIMRAVQWLLGTEEKSVHGLISREELQMVLEIRGQEGVTQGEARDLNLLSNNLFTFRDKKARDAMVPLSDIKGLPSHATVGNMRRRMQGTQDAFIPIFHQNPQQIIGIAVARDLILTPDQAQLRAHIRPPWFVPQDSDLMAILQQFRRNQQSVAVVLDTQGGAVGLLQLDSVLEQIFPNIVSTHPVTKPDSVMIDRLFAGDTLVKEINEQYGVQLAADDEETLAELVEYNLGHHPEPGESCMVGGFQLTVEEVSLLEIHAVRVRSR